MKKSEKVALSGLVISVYIVFVYLTQFLSFGQYQIRLATGLYSLAYFFPHLCFPLGLANMLSNILFGGDVVNGMFGFIAGILTTYTIVLFKKITTQKSVLVIPIAIIPSLIIPIWLSYTLDVPYYILVGSLLFGQTISAYTIGLGILYTVERIPKIHK